MSIALFIVHWPGKDTPACLDHATKLAVLGRSMGFNVSSTPVRPGDEIRLCSNCENEAKKTA